MLVGAFLLLILSRVPFALTDWLTVADLCFVVGTLGGLGAAKHAGFFREKASATSSKTAQIIGGSLFGLLAVGSAWFAVVSFADPLVMSEARRVASTHAWSLGVSSSGFAIVVGQLSRMLFGKLFARSESSSSSGELLPLVNSDAARVDPKGYRDGGQPIVVRISDVAKAIEDGVSDARVRLRKNRLTVQRGQAKTMYALTVSDPDRVALGAVKLSTSDEFLALHISHALVPLLGGHSLVLERDTIVVDGSRSTELLERDQLMRMNARLIAGQQEIEVMLEKLKRQDRP